MARISISIIVYAFQILYYYVVFIFILINSVYKTLDWEIYSPDRLKQDIDDGLLEQSNGIVLSLARLDIRGGTFSHADKTRN